MARRKWDEDDNLAVARLVLVVNDGDPNPVIPEGHPEYIRTRDALGLDNKQLTARINMYRSNMPGYVGTISGNPMHADGAVIQRVLKQMIESPAYVRMCGNVFIERLEEQSACP